MRDLTKKIVIPVDGSKNALKSLDYLDLIYGPGHDLDVTFFHVLPFLPQLLTDEKTFDKELWLKQSDLEKKNAQIAERILEEVQTVLIKKGFKKERITTIFQKMQMSTARDICNWAYKEKVDAVALTRRGRTDLETFFMGAISSKLVHYCADCPVWILGGGVHSKKVLVCMDSSKNALRAAGHASFMLSGTDCQATLFHSIRHLRRYVPMEALENVEELQKLWKNKAGEQIAPYMAKAEEMLLNAGFAKEQIAMKVVDGDRSAANEILKEARNNGYGTIVLGRHGESMAKEFMFGSVTNKILHHSPGLAVWIVQ
ncbi:MAG: universal stress protein [Desulfobacteraceae bacterium]